MSNRKQIQEGLIDKFFGVFEKGLEKSREKATAKALKDPKIERKFKQIKKDMDDANRQLDILRKKYTNQ